MAVNANSIPAPGVSLWTRQDIEQAVEGLISLLDALDGDPDFEDTDEDVGCEDEGIDTDTEPGHIPHKQKRVRSSLRTRFAMTTDQKV